MSRYKGNYFEDKESDFLSSNGYVIIDRNYYAGKLGEIDIVAKKDDVYHFIEVMACPGGCLNGGGQPKHELVFG